MSIALYNFKTDSLLNNNLINDSISALETLETRLKSIIQTYNSRMINNDLAVKYCP